MSVAARVLAERCGNSVTLELMEPIVEDPGYRHTVLRCRVAGGGSDAPPTVVLKESNAKGGRFAVEWAALQFMDTLPSAGIFAPRLIAADATRELLVLEDLGRGPRLRELLRGTDRRAAEDCLVRLMRSLARLHAETMGRESEYERHLTLCGRRVPIEHAAYNLLGDLRSFGKFVAAAGVRVDPRLDGELARLIEVLEGPTLRCFTSGDIAPVNCLYVDGRARLVDFEVSAYRNACVDGCYPRMRHLAATDASRIPPELQRDLAGAYRDELQVLGVRWSEPAYEESLLASSAAWLATICSQIPKALEKDKLIILSSRRQRIVAALEEFGSFCEDTHRVPGFCRTAAALRDELQARWSAATDPMPRFAVFQ